MLTPFDILVVCIGNICRSPLVAQVLAARLDEAGVGSAYAVTSAGTHGLQGRAMEERAAAQLLARGVDPSDFRARRLVPAHVEAAGLVLTATESVRRDVVGEHPGALRRTFTVREFAALVPGLDAASPAELVAAAARSRGSLTGVDLDIPDPMGRSVEDHARAASYAEEAVTALVPALARVVSPS